ncbi:MAG: hypothetical protein OD817_06405 [Gammaproteobacteria bacterium]
MMRAPVTGSGGMPGGVLMQELRRRGMGVAGYDLLNAHSAAFATVAGQWPQEAIFNAASDEETPVPELAKWIARLTHTAPRIEHAPERFGQIRGGSLDCARLKNHGWRPAYTLEAGLRLSVDSPPERAVEL